MNNNNFENKHISFVALKTSQFTRKHIERQEATELKKEKEHDRIKREREREYFLFLFLCIIFISTGAQNTRKKIMPPF